MKNNDIISEIIYNPEGFGQRIRLQRETNGWSQVTLAKKAGVSKDTVARYERGTVKDIGTAIWLAEAVGILSIKDPNGSDNADAKLLTVYQKKLKDIMWMIQELLDFAL